MDGNLSKLNQDKSKDLYVPGKEELQHKVGHSSGQET